MNKILVITTIYPISNATKKFVTFKDWTIIIVGDKKTPHEEYFELENQNSNVKYLTPQYQEENFKELSDLIGWNTIGRRNIGFLQALKDGAEIIASVDDDNIPLDNWGKDILLGKETNVYYYETDEIAFDPIGVTNYKELWHRGFPIQNLHERTKKYKITRKTIIPDIQADFWNGDPDIDAVCRLEHKPMCFFDDKYFPIATNTFSPFNSQNTFFSREALKKYMVIPFIGRMDDIWGGYYLESLGFKVVYNKATVFQDRNIQNLTKNMIDESLGYKDTLNLLEMFQKNYDREGYSFDVLSEFLPENAKITMKKYLEYIEKNYV
tara:strand:- start:2203 stop:3171 length:969 start_codon:yes stop_codon:yes gene_type:complete